MATKSYPWSNISTETNEIIKHLINFVVPPKFPSNFSTEGKDFLKNIFKLEPEKRMTAEQLLKHPWIVNDLVDNNKNRASNESKLPIKISNDKRISGIKLKESNKEQQQVFINILHSQENNDGDFSISITDSENSERNDSFQFNQIFNQHEKEKQKEENPIKKMTTSELIKNNFFGRPSII